MEIQEHSRSPAGPADPLAPVAARFGDWTVSFVDRPEAEIAPPPVLHRPIDLLTLTLAAVGAALIVFIALTHWV